MAAKPHLFCELDVPSTVAALADRCPGFWRSEAFERGLIAGGGEALAVDAPYFAREIGGRLRAGGRFREGLRAAAARHLRAAPWADTCRGVAAEMDGGELLAALSAWSARRVPPPAVAAAAPPAADAPELLRAAALGGAPRWRTLGEAALAHAAGCARPQLSRLMATAVGGARAALTAVRSAGAALLDAAAAGQGGGAAPPLLAGLLRGVEPGSRDARRLLLAAAWALSLALAAAPGRLPAAARCEGLVCSRAAAAGEPGCSSAGADAGSGAAPSAAYDLLPGSDDGSGSSGGEDGGSGRRAGRRREHKRKRKRRRRSASPGIFAALAAGEEEEEEGEEGEVAAVDGVWTVGGVAVGRAADAADAVAAAAAAAAARALWRPK